MTAPQRRTLVAATDLSAPARHAADRAAWLARSIGAELLLLHAPESRALTELRQWLGQEVEQRLRDDAGRQLEALAGELQAARQVAVQSRLGEGDVLDAVQRGADEVDAELVVLGTRGAGFLRRLVLGSTAERLLRRTARPVLLVRSLAHEPYRRALLALDLSPGSARVLALARQLLPDARWVLCHAFQVPFEDKLRFAGVDDGVVTKYRAGTRAHAAQQLHALADAAGLARDAWDECIVEGDASQRLVEQEQVRDCDVVVLGKQGRSASQDLLLGSVTSHVLAEGAADVLVAPAA